MDAIVVKKPKTGAKKSKGHKGKQMSRNKASGKYVKQFIRTARNKARHIAKARSLKESADLRKMEAQDGVNGQCRAGAGRSK